MAEQYISLRKVMDDILVHPLLQNLPFERAVNYAVDFIRIIGSPILYHNEISIITIDNYRAMLPCNLNKIIQIRMNNQRKNVFRYTTNTFHLSDCHDESQDLTYKVQGSVIYTSIKEGEIEISYEAILTDKDGYPLIINNSTFTNALELYIKKKWFTIMFDMGNISNQVLQNVQQEYAFAVGQAQNNLILPTIDQMESITNMWTSLLPKHSEHSSTFKNTGTKERLKLH